MYLQKAKKRRKKLFFVDILKATDEKDPDPYQYVTDPQHCKFLNVKQQGRKKEHRRPTLYLMTI